VPDLPAGVDAVIERAVSRSPQARWAAPSDLKHALAALLASPGAGAPVAAPVTAAAAAPGAQAAAPLSSASAPTAPGLIPGAPTSDPAVAAEGGRLTLGKPFNVAEAAAAVADDTQERWLVQK